MKKLFAIWNILISDKWAVFTFEDVPDDPEYMAAPYFKWNISTKDDYFLGLIRNKLNDIKDRKIINETGKRK